MRSVIKMRTSAQFLVCEISLNKITEHVLVEKKEDKYRSEDQDDKVQVLDCDISLKEITEHF